MVVMELVSVAQSFMLHNAGFLVTEPDGATVEAEEVGLRWRYDEDEGWKLMFVDVTGPRRLRAGGTGRTTSARVFDLEQFPPEVVATITDLSPNAWGKGEK